MNIELHEARTPVMDPRYTGESTGFKKGSGILDIDAALRKNLAEKGLVFVGSRFVEATKRSAARVEFVAIDAKYPDEETLRAAYNKWVENA